MRSALRDEADFLADWIAQERVQTNEVQRCWWLVPCFMAAARRHGSDVVDCLELGCSGGLNLIWDRYGYAYVGGSFPGPLLLTGEERTPAALSRSLPRVRSRIGVDAAPPDLRTDEGVRLLKSFVWADQEDRLARLDAAVGIWREDPPEIVVGDLLDELPGLLERADRDVPLLVWQTAALTYLPAGRRRAVRDLLSAAGVAYVETSQPTDGSHDYYGLFVDGTEVAHAEFHGAWLDWRA